MTLYRLIISSPEGAAFDGDVVQLSVKGIEGELAVMAGHVPFLTVLQKGACRLYLEDGTIREAFCEGGILSVQREDVRLLSSGFSWKDDPSRAAN